MQTSTQKPLYWGRTYESRGSERFVFWHRYTDHLVEVSGFLRNGEPIIQQLKEGKQVRPTAGLPHFGYAFEWSTIKDDFEKVSLVEIGFNLKTWRTLQFKN